MDNRLIFRYRSMSAQAESDLLRKASSEAYRPSQ